MNDQDWALRLLDDGHEHIAKFGRECFAEFGRGVVQVEFPKVPKGTTRITARNMSYIDLPTLQTSDDVMTLGEDAAILMRTVETYDSDCQVVVLASIDGGTPASVKMRLEKPLLLDEPGGVH